MDKICVYLCTSVVHFSFMSLFHYGLCLHKPFIKLRFVKTRNGALLKNTT